MEDSDILGGRLLVAQHDTSKPSSVFAFTGLLYYAVMTIILGLAAYFIHPYYIQFRDRRYRQNLRRRHGIPDHDRRPFNLAFAAAKRVHFKPIVVDDDTPERDLPHVSSQSTTLERHVPRQRQNGQSFLGAQSTAKDGSSGSLGGSSQTESRRTSGNTVTASDSDYPLGDFQRRAAAGTTFLQPTKTNHFSARAYVQPEISAARSKHAREHDEEHEKESKKTRVEGGELIDGDEEAGWHEGDGDVEMDEEPTLVSRGFKRTATDEDEGFESSSAREKRARKALHDNERTSHASSTSSGTRSKKRDRMEASGFGDNGLVVDDEDEGRQRRRRRRVVSTTTKTGAHGNGGGRKRGRENVSSGSDDDRSASPSKRVTKHKRDKGISKENKSVDEEATLVQADSQPKGPHIGDEWQAGNVRYRIGPNGQRERRAVVKRRQPCFDMPRDSTHPDRNAEIEVFVEAWLTDEEYKVAKERQELGFPSQGNRVSQLDSPSEPIPHGKRLLYSSVAFKDSVANRNPSSVKTLAPSRVKGATNALTRTSSTQSSAGPGALDSANARVTRTTISLWENQKREAKLLSHLVEQADAAVAAKAVQDKPSVPLIATPESTTLSNQSKPSQASTASSSTTSNTPAPASTSNSFPFAQPVTSGGVANAPKPSDLPSLTIPSAPAKAPEPVQPPTVPFPSTSTGQSKSAASAPPISTFFVKPAESKPAEMASSSAPSSSNAMSNFFAKPPAPAPQFAPAGPTNSFAATQPSVPANPQASTFTFGPSAASAPATAPVQAPVVSSTQTPKNSFSFAPSTSLAPTAAKADAQLSVAPTTAPSLSSRLGGFNAPGQPVAPVTAAAPVSPFGMPAASTPAPSTVSPPTAPGPAPFGFATSAAPAAPTPTATISAAAHASSSNAPGAKFSFGTGPTTAAPASAPMASNTARPSPFTFGTSAAPMAPGAPSAAPVDTKPQSTFSFGPSAPMASSQAAPNGTSSKGSSLFSFTGLGTSNSKPMSFGPTPSAQQAPASIAPPPFGMQNTASASGPTFGNTPAPSAFAAPSTAASQNVSSAPKTTFGFGSGSTFATPATPAPNTATSNMFSASTTPAGMPGPSSMFAPQTPIPAPSFANSTTPAGRPPMTSMFGPNATNGTSAFGQGMTTPAPAKDSSKALFSFNMSTTPAGPPPSKDAPKPMFTFGATTGPTTPAPPPKDTSQAMFAFDPGSTTPAGPPPSKDAPKSTFSFGFGNSAPAATNNNAATTFGSNQPSSSTFGFGPTPQFTFGNSGNSNATQK